jgi:hypothetical protein
MSKGASKMADRYTEEGYWDRLERMKAACQLLQRSPIPDDETTQQLNLMRLGYAEYELRQMLHAVEGKLEVWCGKSDDSIRPLGSILTAEWDYAIGK